jgi:hypothetical protein
MSDFRKQMDSELKAVVIPALREPPFKGSFPHFRRLGEKGVDLLTFQFDRQGGGFVVEIAHCGLGGFTTSWGKHITASELTAWDLHPQNRQRIKPRDGGGTDSWFRFDQGDVGLAAASFLRELPRAEAWWASRD